MGHTVFPPKSAFLIWMLKALGKGQSFIVWHCLVHHQKPVECLESPSSITTVPTL